MSKKWLEFVQKNWIAIILVIVLIAVLWVYILKPYINKLRLDETLKAVAKNSSDISKSFSEEVKRLAGEWDESTNVDFIDGMFGTKQTATNDVLKKIDYLSDDEVKLLSDYFNQVFAQKRGYSFRKSIEKLSSILGWNVDKELQSKFLARMGKLGIVV